MRLLVCAALLCASSAYSAPVAVFEGQGVKVILMDDKCRLPNLAQAMLVRTGREAMAADVSFEGVSLQACWVPAQGGVLIIDQDGDGGMIPLEALQKVKLI